MYKIIENNQIIDVVEELQFVKCLVKSKRLISVDERQANGVMSSDGSKVYHISGTPDTLTEAKHNILYVKIDKEEYDRLTTQVQNTNELTAQVANLEKMILELKSQLKGR